MRLSKIKLHGFKSFVEPTSLLFPSNRVGIVGPNGCGKSNIIDAIRWVMGESSAKHLRGAAMTDVIFNGSLTRQPVAQAAIELVFTEVNLPQYPQRSEIAVKREIDRKGQSTYYLNGIQCRRKDITELFLGTGLGPRSYAIIEQGMISRLIEAKPDELRIYLEEAASISKYKERRKETEQQIQQTRDNLARLNEVRHELATQLEKLQKQAKQAEKYKELHQAKRLFTAQLQAMRWHALDTAIQEQQQFITEQADILAKDLLALQDFDNTHKQQREAQILARNTLQEAQAHFYEIDNAIKQLEQKINHAQERLEQLQWDLEQVENAWQEIQQTLAADEIQLEQVTITWHSTEGELIQQQEVENLAMQALQKAESQLQEWQTTWDTFNQRAAAPNQRSQVEKTRLQHLEQRLEQNQQRLFRLTEQKREWDVDALAQTSTTLEEEIIAVNVELHEAETSLTRYQEGINNLRAEVQTLTTQLQNQQAQVHKFNGRLASLEALQEMALGKSDAAVTTWLQAQGVDAQTMPRLVQALQVESGWERAVEIVLGERLQAICVENLTHFQQALKTPPLGKLAIFQTITGQDVALTNSPKNYLLNKIQVKDNASWNLATLFAGIVAADTLAEAYNLRDNLAPHESVITPTGLWLGSNWLYTQQGGNEQAGTLAREQEINQLLPQIASLTATVQQLTVQLETRRGTLHQEEYQREQAQQLVNNIRQHLAHLRSQLSGNQARLEYTKNQLQRVTEEQAELTEQISEDRQTLEKTRRALHTALAEMDRLADEREQLTRQRSLLQEYVTQSQQTWQAAKDTRHQIAMRLESLRTEQIHLQQGIAKLNTQLQQLGEQKFELKENLTAQREPIQDWQGDLEEIQDKRAVAEESLAQAKQTVTHLEARLGDYAGERQRLETRCNELRTTLEHTRLDCQAKQVRRQTLEEQLASTEFSPVALLGELPDDANEANWAVQIEAVERKLERLGSVNLAALEEFEEQSKRKEYLDNQGDDLNNALKLLDNAINTLDRETRNRFLQTIAEINNYLKTMFSKLFNGGEAKLELLGEDALTAGIAIYARPPGKRNSHIHLLSGGEKALTAIALVFAIFQLNPSPFCLLDEVDAPLDDANVRRFSMLVKAMSERVQFIFISHNKVTMEIAAQLIGITMQEAGVSRPVAVDLDTAVDMVKV